MFSLPLEGAGTAYIEGIPSYIGRLAVAHSVTTGILIAKEISLIMGTEYLIAAGKSGGSRFYESASAISGLGKMAADIVKSLEYLTLRKELRLATMLPWKDVLPSRHLIRNRRAWCPVCLLEWAYENKVVYEPLIWSIQIVNTCNIHKCDLETTCPSCWEENYYLSRRYIPGHCTRCGNWLGSNICNHMASPLQGGRKYIWQLFSF